jgi:hypothetical protein
MPCGPCACHQPCRCSDYLLRVVLLVLPTGFSVALGLHHGVNRDIPSLWHDRALATGARGEADPDPTPEYLARPPRRLVATASAAVRTDVSEVGRARGTTEGEGRDSCDRPVRVPMLASGRGAP